MLDVVRMLNMTKSKKDFDTYIFLNMNIPPYHRWNEMQCSFVQHFTQGNFDTAKRSMSHTTRPQNIWK